MELQVVTENKVEGRSYILVPITKATAKGQPAFVEVCIDDLPEDTYKEVLIQGLKTLLNRGMSKITGSKTEASRKAAFEVAKENAEKLGSVEKGTPGKIRMSAGIRSKAATGKLHTEAMRIARLIAKDQLRAAGYKVSLIAAKTITEIATKMLEREEGKAILEEAKASLAKREKEVPTEKEAASALLAGIEIKEDETKVKAAAKKGKGAKAATPVPPTATQKGQAQHARH